MSAIPEGWKLVPEFPTQSMCECAKYGVDARLSVFKWADGYKAMLADAPQPPEIASLADAQAEIARLRGALEGIVQAYTDPEESDFDRRLALKDAREALK